MSEIKPLIVISYPMLMTVSQMQQIRQLLEGMTEKTGWHFLALDGMGESRVQAFGLPDANLPEFIELKKLVYDNIKAR